MSDPRYSAEVCRRVLELPGSAPLPADAVVAAGAAGDVEHGARVELRFQVAEGRILRGQFRAFGCPHVIAAASWVTDRLGGKGRDALATWDWREAADALEVPPAKFGRLLTVQDAVRDAARNWPVTPGSTV
ncbi:MAG TPA: iron-sulfur cluster assembly scaffold protein [Steroidobacteraceae bacterium]|nr:iron-sulfur cluster assembly scaffold protein [Steroidobacteraceae bacterium]